MKRLISRGFSLTEVVIAIGIASFALVALMALIPVGMTANRSSAEELHASHLLSLVAADLRNTDPRLNGGKSFFLGLQLPYQVSSGQIAFNTVTLPGDVGLPVPSACTAGLDGFDNPASLGAVPHPAFQATVIYLSTPGTGGASPIHARLIVNWPALGPNATIAELTDTAKVKGYVETYVTYPAP